MSLSLNRCLCCQPCDVVSTTLIWVVRHYRSCPHAPPEVTYVSYRCVRCAAVCTRKADIDTHVEKHNWVCHFCHFRLRQTFLCFVLCAKTYTFLHISFKKYSVGIFYYYFSLTISVRQAGVAAHRAVTLEDDRPLDRLTSGNRNVKF